MTMYEWSSAGRRSFIRQAVSVLLLLILAGELRAEDFAIRLEQPMKVGLKFELTGSASEVHRVRRIGADGQSVELGNELVLATNAWRLESKVEVTEVSAKGQPKALKVELKKLTRTRADKTEELLPAGTQITARLEKGTPAYFVNGQKVEAATGRALTEFLPVSEDDKPLDDEMFGTKDQKSVGETWKMNAAALAEAMRSKGVVVAKEDVSGTSKLEEVTTVAGRKYLRVAGALKMDFKNAGAESPTQKLKQGSVQGKFTGLFPVDPTGRKIWDSKEFKIEMLLETKEPDWKEAILTNQTVERKATVNYTFE